MVNKSEHENSISDSVPLWRKVYFLRLPAIFFFLFVPFLISSCEDVLEKRIEDGLETKMPDLVGLSLDEAKDVIDGIGMRVDLNYLDVKSSRLVIKDKNWKVVKQEPKAGVSIKKMEIICLSLIKLEETTFLDLMNECSKKIVELRRLYSGGDDEGEIVDSYSPAVTSAPQTTAAPTTTVVTYSASEYDSASARMQTSKDEVLGHVFLQDQSSPTYVDEDGFYLYVGTSVGYEPWLRFKVQYAGSNWIFWQKLTANIDGLIFTVDFKYSDISRDNSGYKVWEWIDAKPSEETLFMLGLIAKSEETVIRLEGPEYRSDRVLTTREKKAIANVLIVYDGLKTGKIEIKP
jgi:hypothetical protein